MSQNPLEAFCKMASNIIPDRGHTLSVESSAVNEAKLTPGSKLTSELNMKP